MENYVKKWSKRLLTSIGLATIGMLCLTLIALAAPGLVTDLIAVVTDTTISLTWTPAESSNSTVIRHSTTGYPTTETGGTSSYNGTGSYVTVTGLTAGTTYYFSAWGYDGTNYGAVVHLVVTTHAAISDNTTIPYDKPSVAGATEDPNIGVWSIHPIDKILDYFADPTVAHGGLGMPTNNLVMFLAGVGVTFVGLGTYVKWRSFFSSWFIVLILSSLASTIGAMQWITVGFLLLVGAGVWAVEKYSQ